MSSPCRPCPGLYPLFPPLALVLVGLAGWPAVSAAGTWSRHEFHYDIDRRHQACAYDPGRDLLIMNGGQVGFTIPYLDDFWVQPLEGDRVWERRVAPGWGAYQAGYHSALWDAARDRVILFGWFTSPWTWSPGSDAPPAPLPTTGVSAGPIRGHTAILDPVLDRMIVFGGVKDGDQTNRLWILDLSVSPAAWSEPVIAGPKPVPRDLFAGVYDPNGRRLIVYSGDSTIGDQQIWTLNLDGPPVWTAHAPSGPLPPRPGGMASVYDPVADRMIMYGGYSTSPVWQLDASTFTWSALPVQPGPAPQPRLYGGFTYDPNHHALVLMGGQIAGGDPDPIRGDTWSLSLTAPHVWTRIARAGPPGPRVGGQIAWDPGGRRLVVQGGTGYVGPDVWTADPDVEPAAWLDQAPASSPADRSGHSLVRDAANGRLLLFGGEGAGLLADTWSLPLTALAPFGDALTSGPGALSGAGAGWTPIDAPDGPSPRSGHVAVHDAGSARMIVFGGYSAGYQADTWSLSTSGTPAWQELHPLGAAPAGRFGALGVYDSLRDRLIVFGGFSSGGPRNDVRVLTLGSDPRWTSLSPAGTAPSPRYWPAGVYDPVRDRVVLHGGENGAILSDAWALQLSPGAAWVQLSAGLFPRSRHDAEYDFAADRILFFGGDTGDAVESSDIWILTEGATSQVPEAPPPPTGTLRATPNPFRTTTRITLTQPGPASKGRLDILDITGRRVQTIEINKLNASIPVVWDGRNHQNQVVPPGVYLLRLTREAQSPLTTKLTRLP